MIVPGQLLENRNARIPVIRIVCRFPFDKATAEPRWVIEHINQPTHATEIVFESSLVGYSVLATIPLNVPLDGSKETT
jgi:hypothetical protein